MHNMIVEDERGTYFVRYDYNSYNQGDKPIPPLVPEHGPIDGFTELLARNDELHNKKKHKLLKKDLVEHIHNLYGDGEEST